MWIELKYCSDWGTTKINGIDAREYYLEKLNDYEVKERDDKLTIYVKDLNNLMKMIQDIDEEVIIKTCGGNTIIEIFDGGFDGGLVGYR